jgi:uncharacterized protein (DUF1778 family)
VLQVPGALHVLLNVLLNLLPFPMAKKQPHTKPELSQQPKPDAPTKPELSQTPAPDATTEPGLSNNKSKGGRPRKAPDVTPWTIRGVDAETRTAIDKAATRAGKTLGQYMNEDVRSFAQEQLKKGQTPPMRQEDIRTELDDIKAMIAGLADRMPAQEKRGLMARLFG